MRQAAIAGRLAEADARLAYVRIIARKKRQLGAEGAAVSPEPCRAPNSFE